MRLKQALATWRFWHLPIFITGFYYVDRILMQREIYISLSCAVTIGMVVAPNANAQTAVERNLPPVPAVSAAPIVPPNAVPESEDATPLGVNLRAIVLLGAKDAASNTATIANGVYLDKVSILDRQQTREALARFIGQPLSRKLIAEIQAEIAGQSRSVQRPFVSLSTPEQEISGGVLQIRVTEFRAGKVAARGVEGSSAAAVVGGVRLKQGDPVVSSVLTEDLDWLNRNPFREVRAQFSPASSELATDLTLDVTARRPYRFFAGWANSGSPSTGLSRTYLGTVAALPGLRDAYVSYQLTGSSDFWHGDGSFFNTPARYLSQGVRVYVPTFARQDIEFTFSDALTNQDVNADFSVRQRTSEATLGYRMAMSELGLPAGSGDVLLGVEGKRQRREVFFGGESALDLSADAWQVLAGWSKGWQGVGGQLTAAVNLHASPGGTSDRSSGERLAELTNGRVKSDKYSYVAVDLSGAARLPYDMAYSGQLSGQYASKVLPLSAQIGIGGDGLVRGYSSEDGSFDAGIVSRNELRLAPFNMLKRVSGPDDQLAPFVFLDVGHGRDLELKTHSTVAAAGVGADYTLGQSVSAGLNTAVALKDGQHTKRGDWRLQARLTINF
jgi:hemolysin activation/secretion protein